MSYSLHHDVRSCSPATAIITAIIDWRFMIGLSLFVRQSNRHPAAGRFNGPAAPLLDRRLMNWE